MERWIENVDAPAEDVAAYRALAQRPLRAPRVKARRCHIYAGRAVYRRTSAPCAHTAQPADPNAESAGAWWLVALAALLAAVAQIAWWL